MLGTDVSSMFDPLMIIRLLAKALCHGHLNFILRLSGILFGYRLLLVTLSIPRGALGIAPSGA